MPIGAEDYPPTVEELNSEFFGIHEGGFPKEADLQSSLVAEAIRLALDSAPHAEDGWARMHTLALRSWVTRKLRSVIPVLENPNPDEPDLFTEVLKGKGANLVFLGDVIELSNGYYSPAPTRRVPIDGHYSVLVSGVPTRYFAEAGLKVVIAGVGRRVHFSHANVSGGLSIPTQDRRSYVGVMQSGMFDQAALENLMKSEVRKAWAPEKSWLCYQGNLGRYDFDWAPNDKQVVTPLGFLSLWQVPSEFGGVRQYWLRVRQREWDRMVQVPNRLFKHVCLILDLWADNSRVVHVAHGEGGAELGVGFSPPASQWRWLHAVGATWLGWKGSMIKWWVPAESVPSAIENFQELPLKLEERRRP